MIQTPQFAVTAKLRCGLLAWLWRYSPKHMAEPFIILGSVDGQANCWAPCGHFLDPGEGEHPMDIVEIGAPPVRFRDFEQVPVLQMGVVQ